MNRRHNKTIKRGGNPPKFGLKLNVEEINEDYKEHVKNIHQARKTPQHIIEKHIQEIRDKQNKVPSKNPFSRRAISPFKIKHTRKASRSHSKSRSHHSKSRTISRNRGH